MTESSPPPGRRSRTLGTRITIALVAGIAVGVFLGELSAPLEVVGDIYVALLQMTVLPYVMVSLIGKIGSLSIDGARKLAGRAGLVLLSFWVVSLFLVFILPLSLPTWEAGTFFSSSMVQEPAKLDFLELYLPTNPFHSLANNIVPATVLFSILMGVALISIPKKNVLLAPLHVVNDALAGISNFVMRLSPLGTFALAAGAAGSLYPNQLARLMGYVGTYTLGIVLLSFIILPAIVAAVTPYKLLEFLKGMKDAILMALATSKLFAVLPMIIDNAKDLLVIRGVPEEEAHDTADMLVPLSYPFPNAGKIMGLLFIPFAAWYSGQPLELVDYPLLLPIGLLAFFGSPIAAIPFLLELFRLPMDLFPLFLVAGIWCARLGDVLGAVHLAAFTVITSAWNRGLMTLRARKLVPLLVLIVAGTGAAMLLNNLLIKEAISGETPPLNLVEGMELSSELVEITVEDPAARNPEPLQPGEGHLERILRTKVLRVGFVADSAPFCYRNAHGNIVGLDIELIQRLAADLEVSLTLVPTTRGEIGPGFRDDLYDLAVGAVHSSIRNLEYFTESDTYLELHAAIVVHDHRVREFRSLEVIESTPGLRVACVEGGLLVRAERSRALGVEVVMIPSEAEFLRGDREDLDALLTTAESGAVNSMIHPRFAVVIPEGVLAKVPIVVAIARSADLERLVNTWVGLKQEDATVDELYEDWVLGRAAQQAREPRWSVIRDVFGWVD